MTGDTMKLLVEYITEQRRRDRERYAQTYQTIYETDDSKVDEKETKEKE